MNTRRCAHQKLGWVNAEASSPLPFSYAPHPEAAAGADESERVAGSGQGEPFRPVVSDHGPRLNEAVAVVQQSVPPRVPPDF
jgi:hypothetical protein